jgi:hypothetical protein
LTRNESSNYWIGPNFQNLELTEAPSILPSQRFPSRQSYPVNAFPAANLTQSTLLCRRIGWFLPKRAIGQQVFAPTAASSVSAAAAAAAATEVTVASARFNKEEGV